MINAGERTQPLRVAIIGSGPAGFYAAERLFSQPDVVFEVDMFDRLPTPFGLVRAGVAPDHQKIKTVTRVFDRIAGNPNFRFFGNVEFGGDISLTDLRTHYHQIVFCTGAQTDRQLRIPGEESAGCHGATEFVAWYNGHPDYRECRFDLSHKSVAVVGVGNVAVDVARVLCRTPEELEATDIASHALDALRRSRVEEVTILGRRGPAQAAFTNAEIKELGELADADLAIKPEEAELDDVSRAWLEEHGDKATRRKVEIIQETAARESAGKRRRLTLRFLVSPVEIVSDGDDHITALQLVRNELYAAKRGSVRARPTEHHEELPAGLMFRSVGYRGVPLSGVPFDNGWGVIPNEKGRLIEQYTHRAVLGTYAAGWIKRGPSGVIGTNKPDAAETVECMVEDAAAGKTFSPAEPSPSAAEQMVRERQPNCFSYTDWLRLNEIEVVTGQKAGRPREKMTSVDEMLSALEREEVRGARKRILLPTDFSSSADQALTHALCLTRHFDAELHMLHVSVFHEDDPRNHSVKFPDNLEMYARLDSLCGLKMDHKDREEFEFRQVKVRGTSVDCEILGYVDQNDIDLIVMGTHGQRGMQQLVIGSIAEKIVRLAHCPVMTVLEQKKSDSRERFQRILVPIDFSSYSRLSLQHAKRIAADYGARLQLLHVVEEVIRPTFYYASESPPGLALTPDLEQRSEEAMREMLESTPGPEVEAEYHVAEGHAAAMIVDYAESRQSDLLVIATHGLTGFEQLLLGSTTARVVRRAPCPVFTVKAFGKFFV